MFSQTVYHLNTYILRCVQGPFFTLMPQPSFIPQTTAGQTHKHYASSDVVHRHSGDAPSHTSDVVITYKNEHPIWLYIIV